jgi:hypothetical protein
MSLPKLPELPDKCSIDNAICQILISIAMEEIGLSHIINAEGEKLQYVLGTLPGTEPPNPTVSQILEINESVKDMLQQVAFNQMFLNAKMSAALKAYLQNKTGGGNGNGSGNGNGETPGKPPKITVDINGDYTEIIIGNGSVLAYVIKPEEYEDKAVWSSSDPTVASVDGNGVVTAHKLGETVVTLTVEGVSDTIKIKVIPDGEAGQTPDIVGTKVGESIIIDGTEWIKISGDYNGDTKYSLLMLKNVLEPSRAYGDNVENLQYHNSEIKKQVDGWYDNLKSPALKAMAVQANIGTDNNSSWPLGQTGIYAHIPRWVNLRNLDASVISAGKPYWLAAPAQIDEGYGWTAQETVAANGSHSAKENVREGIYARPIIWVRTAPIVSQ